jgi:hypothetical protein
MLLRLSILIVDDFPLGFHQGASGRPFIHLGRDAKIAV